MLNRLSRLFQADFHAVLDQLEDPEALLKQNLRDMELEIRQVEQRLQALNIDQKQLQQQLSHCRHRQEEIGPQLDLCFKSNNEELARELVRQRLQWQKQQSQLGQKLKRNREQYQALEEKLVGFRQQYNELKQKADLVLDRDVAETGEINRSTSNVYTVSDCELELAWLQEKEKRGGSGPAPAAKKGGDDRE